MTHDLDLLSIPKTAGDLAAAPDPYLAAMAVWLEGKPANTQRSYYRATQQADAGPFRETPWSNNAAGHRQLERTA
jgi:hypothetical protein